MFSSILWDLLIFLWEKWNVRWHRTDFRNWKYRSIVTTKKNFSPLRVVPQASPEPYFFEKWKFAILVLEAWDHHQMNSHEVGTWIYVPHLISAMFGFCTNLHWNLHKLGSDTVYFCKFLCRLVQKPIIVPGFLCHTWYLLFLVSAQACTEICTNIQCQSPICANFNANLCKNQM